MKYTVRKPGSKYIIEHLEPELSNWCFIEYERISLMVGKSNLWFTNVKSQKDRVRLSKLGKVIIDSVKNLELKRVCVLDPDAAVTLKPLDVTKFDYFVFGGILGDYPPKKRTKAELTAFLPHADKRNIGKKQFSTDNAVYVTQEILSGKNLESMKFKDKIEIKVNDVESIILPYLYPIINSKPSISPKIIDYLKKKKGM